ncbi:putative membrane spanning protein [Magnetospirillum sp. LM-5]|uniref:DMT family transporter n=1 Tax=Magnetospirillum sp. LM-5 TaxID=2681466 RepID=UPI00137ECF12|nr:DMT family transporter [Magnetospirillum sp. LM-5]CAA7612727.1 putative membrane spanning protein [Magnetospirillum sp. LM-5]
MFAILMGLAAALAWGTADFAARFSGRVLGPPLALLVVTATGAVMVSAWLAVTGTAPPSHPTPAGLLYGALSVIGTLALYEALNRAPIATVAPLAGAFPAWSILYMVIFDGLRPEPMVWAAMALVMAGMWLVARFASDAPDDTRRAKGGTILALLAGGLFGLTLVAGLHATLDHGQGPALWLARVVGVVLVVPFVWLRHRPTRLPPPGWLGLAAIQGVLDTLAFVAILAVKTEENAAIAGTVSSSFGIVTVALARLFLKKAIHRLQWLGIIATFAGIATLSALG